MKLISLLTLIVTLNLLTSALLTPRSFASDEASPPDFTRGDKIPKDAKHDWTLGPTGARGWIFSHNLETSKAKQIYVTRVNNDSPASSVLKTGDVILGVGGKSFSYDPRTEFGKAIVAAEATDGKLTVTRWRDGKTEEISIELAVLGTYSPTAPYDCPKSAKILKLGAEALAARMSDESYARNTDPIPRALDGLALLATGEEKYLPLLKRESEWAANFSDNGMQTWYYGYVMIFLAEYASATGDQSVLPGLKRLALEAAKGQSSVGSWGHGFARPDGRLGGYGMMNSPGVPLTTGLVLAREAGISDPAIDEAIERSARLIRFYIGKGAVPYGDHHPWTENHDDNGKCGMAATLFTFLGEKEGAEFFSRMSVASHSSERDCGHTGNYFNITWAMPGVARLGPHATGAWMKEFGSWYFDFARGSDGSFMHQGPPEPSFDSYEGWDCSGAVLLAYAMPLKKIRLTGKKAEIIPQVDSNEAESLIADGRGWSNDNRDSFYDSMSDADLLTRLESWSPIVRERAAMAIGRRSAPPVDAVVTLLNSSRLEAQYGACQAIISLRNRGESAVSKLQELLRSEDLWLRIKAAEALAMIGSKAKVALPDMLALLAQVDKVKDPRGMQQRYLSFVLFDRSFGGLIGGSLEGVDREALYVAVRAGLKNQDGRARGSLASVYRNLSSEEIKPLLPEIYQAVMQPAPSGEMFADEIRVEGLKLLAKHKIREGIEACVIYTRDQNPWSSENRTPELMKILLSYGTHAEGVIPELEKLADYFENDEPDFPRHLMKLKAKIVRDTITKIKTSKETPDLIGIE